MEGEPRINGDRSSEMDRFVADGNEVVEFKLIRNVSDLEDKKLAFNPEMCHQVFNEGETIFGYENLKIKVYLTAGSLKTYLGIDYKTKIPEAMSDGVEPDDLVDKLDKVLRGGYTSNLDEFSSYIEKEQKAFKPFGELVHGFTQTFDSNKKNKGAKKKEGKSMNGTNGESQNGYANAEKAYEVFSIDNITAPKFNDYLKRMETFLLFFVDAGCFLDCDDDKWRIFTLFEKYKTSEGNTAYALVGYSSVYQFYSYPDLIRPRIAQMIILPPYQKQGLAANLMSCIYGHYRNNLRVKEITVEDPSDECELLRDFVDARDCKKLPTYAPENLKKGYTPAMTEEALKVLKLTKRQAHRIYEMLRLQITNVNNEAEFKEFRLAVKQRLNIPYQKQQSDIKRMKKRNVNNVELDKATALDDGTRKTELESNFQLCLAHYNNVLRRLEKYGSS